MLWLFGLAAHKSVAHHQSVLRGLAQYNQQHAPPLQVFTNDAGGRHKFFMVWNYVRQLRRWIKGRQRTAATLQVSFLTESTLHVNYHA
jgi:hypothetical protein